MATQGPATTGDPERHLPADHSPLPALDGDEPTPLSASAFQEVQGSAEFTELRSRFRRFAFPMTAAFLVWYFAYVLLSTYAESFMNIRVFGNVSLGILLGLLQFLTTFIITWVYIRHANKNLDPLAAKLRDKLEGSAR
jgi:uncharacterized membrane protein (DUF485 family)